MALDSVLFQFQRFFAALREEHRLSASVNRALRRIFGPKWKRQGYGEDCLTRSFITCTRHQQGNQSKENTNRCAYSTQGRVEKCV